MPKLETLIDAFTGSAINTALWNSITGTATLDTVNDLVSLAVPTGTGVTNMLATTSTFDATGSSLYAQVGVGARGNGTIAVGMRLSAGVGNNVLIRCYQGALDAVVTIGGSSTVTNLAAVYDPHAHRWWRLTEAAGTFRCAVSADGLTWTTLGTVPYSTWSASAVTVEFLALSTAAEVAGNGITVSHVNTRTGGQANPNWPVVEYGAGLYWGANGASMPLDAYVDVSLRTQGTGGTNRGKQFELDQVRAGEETVTLGNADGYLDTASTASPVAGHIQPFQPFRVRAQWPPTINLMSQGVASGGDVGGVALGAITPSIALDLATDTDITGGSVVTSTSAWRGTTVTQFTVTNGAPVGQRVAHCAQTAMLPGQTYTAQIRVRNITASTTLQVKAALGWIGSASLTPSSSTYGSTVTLTGGASAGWTTITVTGTAPANAFGMDVSVVVAATAAANCTIQTDGWQTEKGAIASGWVMPGAWFPWFAGFTEDEPAQWAMSGTYGTVSPPVSDAFSLLSQLELSDPLTMELGSPRFLYTLDDPAGSTSFTDTTGNFPAITAAASKYGAGTVVAGADITSAAASGVYTGATGTVVTITNPSPGANAPTAAASFLGLGAAGILGPQGTTFTRVIAFRYTAGSNPAAEAELWTAMDINGGATPGGQLRLYIDSAGHVNLTMASFLNGGISLSSATPVADSNWHLAIFGQDAVGGSNTTAFLSVDGTFTSADASGGGGHGTPNFPLNLVSDAVGAAFYAPVGTTNYAFKGDISYVAELPNALTSTGCSGLYTAWRSAAAGESTDARYRRILRYAGYTGPTSIQTGMTTSMGPADTAGQNAVAALQNVVDTENGAHFIGKDGTPTFLARSARYNARIPVYTFGERTDLGEWPYEDCRPVFDSTHLGNKITVTQASTGQNFYAKDDASIAAYFPRPLSRTVNASSGLECQDAADYLLSRYKKPVNRIVALQLRPSAYPALWPVCLGLEQGTRVRVMRRPPGVAVTQIDCFIENLAWSWDDKNEATLTLQCSPADLAPYAVFAAWHTTLNTAASAGATTITVNASQDTTNPLATQLAAGQQLVLGQNTANQETVTVASVGATSPGWTTAVITLTAATTKSHAAGDLVNEPLPAGVTDPTTYDAASAFDASVFAY